MGLLNTRIADPMLQKIARQVESTVKPEVKREFEACVVAGMKLMWSPKTHQLMLDYLQLIKGPEDIVKVISHGIVKVASIIVNKSGRQDVMPGIGPAAVVLMCQTLEFIEKKSGFDITPQIAADTTKAVGQGIFQMYGITAQQIDQAVSRSKGGAPGGSSPMPGADDGAPSMPPPNASTSLPA